MAKLVCNVDNYKKWRALFDDECKANGLQPGRKTVLPKDKLEEFVASGAGKALNDHVTESGQPAAKAVLEKNRSGIDRDHFLGATFSLTNHNVTLAEQFLDMDTDGNGTISMADLKDNLDEEGREALRDFIERFDKDEDGQVTLEEFFDLKHA